MIGLLATISAQTRLLVVLVALAFMLVLVELVRRRRLQERYTIAWFVATVALWLCVLVPQLIERLADLLGIADTNAALFALGFFLVFALLLHLTVVISRLNQQIVRLSQELAILRAEDAGGKRALGAVAARGEDSLDSESDAQGH